MEEREYRLEGCYVVVRENGTREADIVIPIDPLLYFKITDCMRADVDFDSSDPDSPKIIVRLRDPGWCDQEAEEEYCDWCCTTYLKNKECPGCDCYKILDEMIEGDPQDLMEECVDELDCPLEDWDDP